jgi:hypothetical protein
MNRHSISKPKELRSSISHRYGGKSIMEKAGISIPKNHTNWEAKPAYSLNTCIRKFIDI